MFFSSYNSYEGEPARLYRSPDAIRRDINEIKEKIRKVDSEFNIRNLITEMLGSSRGESIETWLPVLASIVSDAEDSLEELHRLRDSLDVLTEELEDTGWVMGIE